jgi:hypothetical protein
MPRTEEITAAVLSGEGIVRCTDGVYRFGGPQSFVAGDTPRVLCLLKVLSSEVGHYYGGTRSANYEDYCYVVTQLCDSESGEFDNPAVQPMIDKLSQVSELRPLMQSMEDRLRLFRESQSYIHDVLCQKLAKEPESLGYLNWLLEGVRDRNVEPDGFFTLNHDRVLEKALRDSGVSYCDGFGPDSDGIRFWEPGRLEESDRVRLCKLHGSIDWFWFPSRKTVGIPLAPTRGDPSAQPVILVGTFNKMQQYTAGIFADLHCYFCKCLRRLDSLVCCGYGFCDKGVNTKLAEWIEADHPGRLIVVHPEPDRLMTCSRPAIAKHSRGWQARGQLNFVEKRAEEVTWAEVRAALFA